jgi:aromatic-L-amino-acid decarboxylase
VGLQHHIRAHVALAQELAAWLRSDPRFVLDVDPPLNLVCFRHAGGDEPTQALLDALNATGRVLLTHTRLGGRLTIRVSIGATQTARVHVDRLRDLIDELAPAPGR